MSHFPIEKAATSGSEQAAVMAAKTKAAILDLASKSYRASSSPRIVQLQIEARTLLEAAASKKIFGGFIAGALIEIGERYISDRFATAVTEIKKASETLDVSAYRDMLADLLDILSTLTDNVDGTAMGQLSPFLQTIPNVAGAISDGTGRFDQAIVTAKTVALPELEHFVESRKASGRKIWRERAEKLLWVVVGVAITLIFQSVTKLLSHP